MSNENASEAAEKAPASPAIVKKAASTIAKPKITAKPAPAPAPAISPKPVEKAVEKPADNSAGNSPGTKPSETNPFSIFGWGD